jgi:hypothetical protein
MEIKRHIRFLTATMNVIQASKIPLFLFRFSRKNYNLNQLLSWIIFTEYLGLGYQMSENVHSGGRA